MVATAVTMMIPTGMIFWAILGIIVVKAVIIVVTIAIATTIQ